MATTTAELQAMQASDQETENAPMTQAAGLLSQPATTTAVPTAPGLLENTVGRAFPNMREILAQPAVKKATPMIMIGILLVFLSPPIWRCKSLCIDPSFPE